MRSADRRRTTARAKSDSSAATPSAVPEDARPYVRDVQSIRTRARTSWPEAMNASVSLSNSAGCEAGFVSRRSSTGSTSPRPMTWNQMRLTCALAKRRFSVPVIQTASDSSLSWPAAPAAGAPPSSRGVAGWSVRGFFSSCGSFTTTICSPTNSCLSSLSCRSFFTTS